MVERILVEQLGSNKRNSTKTQRMLIVQVYCGLTQVKYHLRRQICQLDSSMLNLLFVRWKQLNTKVYYLVAQQR